MHWIEGRDGDKGALALYERHYSCYQYKDGRTRNRFVGPGERIVLTTLFYDALFVWRVFRSLDHQQGVNCAIFRNESSILSSELILEAMQHAFRRWGGAEAVHLRQPAQNRQHQSGVLFQSLRLDTVRSYQRTRSAHPGISAMTFDP